MADCGCNQTNNCEPVKCGCKINLDSLCLTYSGKVLPNLGIQPGTRGEDIFIAIDEYVANVMSQLVNGVIGGNIGGGIELYESVGSNFKTFTDSTSVTASNPTDSTVEFAVNETWLDTFVDTVVDPQFSTINTEGVLQVQVGGVNVGTTTKTFNIVGNAVQSVVDEGSNKTTMTILGFPWTSVNIPAWDMDTNDTIAVPHGLTAGQAVTITNISALISPDTGSLAEYRPLDSVNNVGVVQGGVEYIDTTNIYLRRVAGGVFDNVDYDNGIQNRGIVRFQYLNIYE